MYSLGSLGSGAIDQISAHDLISFDVFDTLILRTVSSPRDVFELVKLKLIASRAALLYPEIIGAFPALRVRAEELARQAKQKEQGTREVTFDEIYQELGSLSHANPDTIALLKETELRMESQVTYVNPVGRELWSAAVRQHKKVVFSSDMYLPGGFIAGLLQRCGYDRYHALYVSCEHARSKHEGALFGYIAAEQGVTPERVLHIGDNRHADYTKAREAGCSAIHLAPTAAPAGIPVAAGREGPQHARTVSATIQGVIGKRALTRGLPADPWEALGYQVFGPLFTGFLYWLTTMAQRNRPERILLFSRDMHFVHAHLRRFLQAAGMDADIRYLYVSRGSLLAPSLTDFPLPRLDHLFSGKFRRSVAEHLRKLGLVPELFRDAAQSCGFESLDDMVPNGDPRMRALLAKLWRHLLTETTRQRPVVRRYIEPFVAGARNIMLADIGWVGNMQSSFLRLLEPRASELKVRGYYLGLHRGAKDNDYAGHTMEGWLTHYGDPNWVEEKIWWSGGVELLEFAMCAPHGTTLGYNFTESGEVQPILESNDLDGDHLALSACIQSGAQQFLEEYLDIYQDIPAAALASRAWAGNFYRLVTAPTLEEAELLGELTHSDAAGDTERRLPLAPKLATSDPQRVAEAMTQSYWKAGFKVRNEPAREPHGAPAAGAEGPVA